MATIDTKSKPHRFLNRELSWLEFNQRVLDEAHDPSNPPLERLKFFTIVSSNLDEFFEVRVAGVKQQLESGTTETEPDGLSPLEIQETVTRRVRRMVEDQCRCWREEIVPSLAARGIHFVGFEDLSADDRRWVENYYRANVRPVLTPLSHDPAHPFPHLLNKSLNLIVRINMKPSAAGSTLAKGAAASSSRPQLGATGERLAVVQVPAILPRLVRLPHGARQHDYLLLGRLIKHYLPDLFPGAEILGAWAFRVTRNSELYIDEVDTANLLKAVEKEIHNRRKGEAVRLEIEADCPARFRDRLLEHLGLTDDDLYVVEGPLNPAKLMALCDGDHPPELKDPPFAAPVASALSERENIFTTLRERDILLHHPYESYASVVDFLRQAADDPQVLAIKQTLYRTGGDLRIVGALMDAVRNGKQVTAVVELKARFDEANNVVWARRLEEAGVHVVYGLVGYKIHGKMCLVVRNEPDGIRRYLHLGTGNYNPSTAKLYTDLSLFTARAEFCEDATNLFNLLTGVCQFQEAKKFLVAPFTLHERMMELIRRETANARRGLPARIIAKMNSLVDPEIIEGLYEASQAGVKCDLIIRGICCLRPHVKGMSENITVRSIVGRFLEHSRVFYFENACAPEVFVGSADWMPRNFFRRIEVVFPIEDGQLRERIISEILALNLADNSKARLLQSDGSYLRVAPRRVEPVVNCQAEFIRRALAESNAVDKPKAKGRKYPKVKLRSRPK